MLKDVEIKNMQVSNVVSSGEKNYQYFIDDMDDDDFRIKPLQIMFSKTYIKKVTMMKQNGCIFWLEMMNH